MFHDTFPPLSWERISYFMDVSAWIWDIIRNGCVLDPDFRRAFSFAWPLCSTTVTFSLLLEEVYLARPKWPIQTHSECVSACYVHGKDISPFSVLSDRVLHPSSKFVQQSRIFYSNAISVPHMHAILVQNYEEFRWNGNKSSATETQQHGWQLILPILVYYVVEPSRNSYRGLAAWWQDWY